MERQGVATERGNRNRRAQDENSQLRQLGAQIRKLQTWAADAPPMSLVDVVNGILENHETKTIWQQVYSLKDAAAALLFFQENNIRTMEQLQEKVSDISRRYHKLSDENKRKERRRNTLKEHLRQSDIYQQHEPIFSRYQRLKPPQRDEYYRQHECEIRLFQSARNYLAGVLNGHAMPLSTWKAEYAQLEAERSSLSQRVVALRKEIVSVRMIQQTAERMVSEAGCGVTRAKTWLEL